MPTTRRRRARGRTVLTLDALDFRDLLSLSSGWVPGRGATRWRTWGQFFADYGVLRGEFLEFMAGQHAPRLPGLPFAEWLYLETGGAPSRVAALEEEGDQLTAAERERCPALRVYGICALYRERERGGWRSAVTRYAEAVVGRRPAGAEGAPA